MPSSRFLENYSFLTVPVPVPVFGGGWGLPQIGGKFRPGALAALALAARNAAGSGLICPGWRALLACVVCAVRFDGGAGAFAPADRQRTTDTCKPHSFRLVLHDARQSGADVKRDARRRDHHGKVKAVRRDSVSYGAVSRRTAFVRAVYQAAR